ncbi:MULTISPECIES: XVIPCD domain-containing protein [Stenotrophomonas]|uniref:XVIPCD domain-containing protein n=1 Tax=Stenotrophomonas TaxID=40323 RepID=UPI000871D0E5|nr:MULTISPECIES: XVIPCD domain-containing protein [Stenotrophomonas]OEZ01344.1 phospholipase [Stenotrophomonas sp. BIIR7]
MSGPDNEARSRAIQEQNRLVQQLRDSGNDNAADRLQETYHAREMSGLAADVYLSAKHDGEPPAGWTRASVDPAALRAAGIEMSDAEIRVRLQPPDSGFRAEIYLPDKRVFGDDAKPVVVFKGSTGEIIDPAAPSGRRESGGEDFLNNGQQGIGMRSDYYDRAMQLGALLNQKTAGNFEIAGHSLGGGMASAASAVTGARATTFNAAGLHPDTASRYAKDNGLPTFNPQQTVHTYQTSGEVLNDVQNGLQRLNERQRNGYGLLANEASKLLQEPMMQSLVTEKMREMLPPGAQTAAAQFVEQLGSKPGNEALRNVPVAAGRMEIVLDAKTRIAGELVDRARTAAPSQVAELAGPLSTVLHAGAQGMRAGRVAGEQVERAGAGVAYALDKTGDGLEQVARVQGMVVGKVVETGSATLRVGVQGGTTVIASGRELTGMVEATRDRVRGHLMAGPLSALSAGADLIGLDDVSKRLQANAEQIRTTQESRAVEAEREAREDAATVRAAGQRVADGIDRQGQWVAGTLRNGYATAGAYVDQGYDFSAYHVKNVTAQAPAVLATVGGVGTATAAAVATHVPTANRPQNLLNLAETAVFANRIMPSFGEAAARHGMADTVIPSLDAELEKQEARARDLLEKHERIQHPGEKHAAIAAEPSTLVVGINDPGHRQYHMFQGAQSGVHGIDAAHNRVPDLQSDQLAGALAAKATQEGLERIERVVLSEDRTRVFAVDTQDLTSVHRQLAQVDVVAGRQQPLSVSTEQVAEVQRQQERSAAAPALAADLGAEQREQEQQAARRMG